MKFYAFCLLAFFISVGVGQPIVKDDDKFKGLKAAHKLTGYPMKRESIFKRETSELAKLAEEARKKFSFVTKDPPPCAQGKTFCEEVDDYPKAYLDFLISNNLEELTMLFHENAELSTETEPPIISQKVDNPTTICPSKIKIFKFQKALTCNGEWKFILNHGNYSQQIRVESCLNDVKSDCRRAHLDPYSTRCEQKYVYMQLVALNKNGKLSLDSFNIPSCCSCVMLVNEEYLSTSTFTTMTPAT